VEIIDKVDHQLLASLV